ncbi:MAG: hypothetical protein KAR19_02195 [Bacteroidales bacterium]|nr:hypothetical protein [Bacteroidales bacterium]
MKKISLLLTIILVSIPSFSQDNTYLSAMLNTIELMDTASGGDDYLQCANQFERIATAEKSQWFPYYYASYSLVLMSFDEPDGNQKDLLLDRAQLLLDSAFIIVPEESELHVLQAFLYPSRILVDPMGRGMLYMEKMFASLETAKALNPDNPRTYFLEGINKLNLPPSMGGGPEVAKPLFIKADAKFKTFHHENPMWPDWGEDANSAELDKLQ